MQESRPQRCTQLEKQQEAAGLVTVTLPRSPFASLLAFLQPFPPPLASGFCLSHPLGRDLVTFNSGYLDLTCL